MKVYLVTELELKTLLERLELAKLRQMNFHAPTSTIHKSEIDDLHRIFHYVAVQWTQEVGK
jgi:hypothetical protein